MTLFGATTLGQSEQKRIDNEEVLRFQALL